MDQTRTPHVDARLSALETRVESIAGSLTEVVEAVRGLGDKLDLRGRTPWTAIWSALATIAGVIAMIGGLAYYPLKDAQTDLKGSLLLIQDRSDKRIEQLAATQVTRAEHEVHWRQQDREYDFMRDRIGRVEIRLEKRLERLEGRYFKPDH